MIGILFISEAVYTFEIVPSWLMDFNGEFNICVGKDEEKRKLNHKDVLTVSRIVNSQQMTWQGLLLLVIQRNQEKRPHSMEKLRTEITFPSIWQNTDFYSSCTFDDNIFRLKGIFLSLEIQIFVGFKSLFEYFTYLLCQDLNQVT